MKIYTTPRLGAIELLVACAVIIAFALVRLQWPQIEY
jgi:hypothetical protein